MLPKTPPTKPTTIANWLEYDPVDGDLWWKVSRGPLKAGTLVLGNYIKINGYSLVVGRVIWCLQTGEWPPEDRLIDHKNRIHSDNKWSNLRLATYTQNSQNKSGYAWMPKGVSRRDRIRKSYVAKIMVDGKNIHIGSFETEAEAAKAYKEACLKYHGEFACPE